MYATPNTIARTDRMALLASEVSRQVSRGGRVEVQTDYQAVVVFGRRPSHLLHLILTLVTLGVWGLFVWLPLASFGGEKRRVIRVDEYGNIHITKGRG